MFGLPELVVILIIVVLVFGPGNLPQLGKSLAQAIKGFKKTMRDPKELVEDQAASKNRPNESSGP